MDIEYDLNDQLSFPTNLIEKKLEGYYVVLAPSLPNWLILDEYEYIMFSFLCKGMTIRESLEKYYIDYCDNESQCLMIMTDLIEQIVDVNFTADATSSSEEPIETIVKNVHIGTTNGCNMRCKHCYMAAGSSALQTIDLDKTVKIIKDLNTVYGSLEVVVSGGEPLAYNGIFKLLHQIKDNHIILFTNGSLITEENIDIIAECCNEVQISFEGISKDYYGLIRDRDKYEKVLNALSLLKQRNIRIVMAITVLPDTMYDIKNNLVDFVKSLEYQNLEVRINDEIDFSGNAKSMSISQKDKQNSQDIVIEMIKELEEIGCSAQNNDIRNTRFTNCGIGTNVVINYDGRIYPCHKFSNYSFPDTMDVNQLIDCFNRINTETSNNLIPKCQACELRYICSGGCRIDNYNTNGNMNAVICDENYKEKQLMRLIKDYKIYREKEK